MILIVIALIAAAAYSGGLWLLTVYRIKRAQKAGVVLSDEFWEAHTFHLGLCFILATGFLGLIVKGG